MATSRPPPSRDSAKDMKVLVTGASGLLGRAVMRRLSATEGFAAVGAGLTRSVAPLIRLDLLDRASVDEAFAATNPDVVVHCAAERFPDRAAKDPERTVALNVRSSKSLAEKCSSIGAKLVYVSTDYVFDGGVETGVSPPYRIDDPTNPLNFYGETKLGGEGAVLGVPGCDPLVLRVPILYGPDCETISESAILAVAEALLPGRSKDASGDDAVVEVDDWGVRFPTSVDDVAAVLARLLSASRRSKRSGAPAAPRGVLHCSSKESATKYEVAKMMADSLGIDSEHVVGDENPSKGARRPKNTQLDCSATWEALGGEPHEFVPLREGIGAAIEPHRHLFEAA